jgi:hypothetical protein
MAGCPLNELYTRGESEFCLDVSEMGSHSPQSAGLRGQCLWVPNGYAEAIEYMSRRHAGSQSRRPLADLLDQSAGAIRSG